MIPVYVVVAWYALVVLVLVRKFSPEIYDVVIVKMTSVWYRTVFERVHEGERVLDIGIGTGTALSRNAPLVVKKKLHVVGVDYDRAYVEKCAKVMQASGLAGQVQVVCKSVYDADLLTVVNQASQTGAGERFDCIYFSGSISLMPDPALALKQSAADMLKPGGLVFITQTFQKRGTKVMEVLKPLLKYFTTIDFGKLTYLQEVDQYCQDSGLEVVERNKIPGSIDNYFQAAYLIVLRKQQ